MGERCQKIIGLRLSCYRLRRCDGVIRKNRYRWHCGEESRFRTERSGENPIGCFCWKDLLGVFERWTSECDRVKILLNLLGYQPSAELHFSMIEKVA